MSVRDDDSMPVRVGSVERTAAAREARIGHEVDMRAQGLGTREEPLPRAVGAQNPALSIVVEVRLQDLVEDLLVHGRVFDRNECLDAAVEVTRHPIGRRYEHERLWRRQSVTVTEADDPGVLQEA